MSVADYTVFGEIVTGSKILVAEYPSKPGGCGIWYKLPNGNKQTAFPKAELEAFLLVEARIWARFLRLRRSLGRWT